MAAPLERPTSPHRGSLARLVLAGLVQLSLFGLPTCVTAGEVRDSSRVQFEIGASTDLTNEQFYEDSFTGEDSIFHRRRLVGSPESQVAGVLHASLGGTRGGGAVDYQVHNELSLGDKVQHDVLDLVWRHELAPDWRFT